MAEPAVVNSNFTDEPITLKPSIRIDQLIEVVRKGGAVKTGVDVYTKEGILLLEKNVLIRSVNALLTLKQNGLSDVPIDDSTDGGIWDTNGKLIEVKNESTAKQEAVNRLPLSDVNEKVKEISALKREAAALHERAKENVVKVVEEIKKTGGKFEQGIIRNSVDEIFTFLARNENAFSYMAKEIFSYDDYLYNHSVNVCTLGVAVLNQFNDQFGETINKYLNSIFVPHNTSGFSDNLTSFILLYPEELRDIAMGYFLHDLGKVLVPEDVLNKKGRLTDEEFELVKAHSYQLGPQLLEKNLISNALIANVVKYHHAALYSDEERTYPTEKLPIEVPPYVKICKLVDIYDAMTSKRCYKEAINPVVVVTEVFRKYAQKEDIVLRLILQAFVNIVGIHPPGSVVYLQNGKLAYIVDSDGPILVPFTNERGEPLPKQQDPVDLSSGEIEDSGLSIDRRKPPLSPAEVQNILPEYLKGS